ncbi:MAG: pirin family protein [Acidiferrobacter sp.]
MEWGNHDGLRAWHHFAIDDGGNPPHRRLGGLAVFIDDEIVPHSGFPVHAHRDREIVTSVCEGVLRDDDNSGSRGKIRAGNGQTLSAGCGITLPFIFSVLGKLASYRATAGHISSVGRPLPRLGPIAYLGTGPLTLDVRAATHTRKGTLRRQPT